MREIVYCYSLQASGAFRDLANQAERKRFAVQGARHNNFLARRLITVSYYSLEVSLIGPRRRKMFFCGIVCAARNACTLIVVRHFSTVHLPCARIDDTHRARRAH